MLQELDVVALVRDLPDYSLKAGDVGAVVLVHGDDGYEVEFVTFGGDTVAVVSLDKDRVRPVGPNEIQHSRPLESTR